MDFTSTSYNKYEKSRQITPNIKSLDNSELDNVHIGFFLGIIYRYYAPFFDEYLKDVNVNQNQFWILLTICNEQDISQERIASLLKLNESTVTREINILEKKNYIIRKTDKNDRRKKNVSLSDKGFEKYKMITEVDRKSESELLKYLSNEELHILKILLKKVIVILEDIMN